MPNFAPVQAAKQSVTLVEAPTTTEDDAAELDARAMNLALGRVASLALCETESPFDRVVSLGADLPSAPLTAREKLQAITST